MLNLPLRVGVLYGDRLLSRRRTCPSSPSGRWTVEAVKSFFFLGRDCVNVISDMLKFSLINMAYQMSYMP